MIFTVFGLSEQGIRTYDYIMAMKEENQSIELDLSDDEDSDFSSDESVDLDSPEKSSFISRFICRGQAQIQVKSRIKNYRNDYFHYFRSFLAVQAINVFYRTTEDCP